MESMKQLAASSSLCVLEYALFLAQKLILTSGEIFNYA